MLIQNHLRKRMDCSLDFRAFGRCRLCDNSECVVVEKKNNNKIPLIGWGITLSKAASAQ